MSAESISQARSPRLRRNQLPPAVVGALAGSVAGWVVGGRGVGWMVGGRAAGWAMVDLTPK
jgi:hypothetical protein